MKVASLVQKCNSRADWVVQGALYSSTSTRRMYQNPQGLSGKRRHVFKDQMWSIYSYGVTRHQGWILTAHPFNWWRSVLMPCCTMKHIDVVWPLVLLKPHPLNPLHDPHGRESTLVKWWPHDSGYSCLWLSYILIWQTFLQRSLVYSGMPLLAVGSWNSSTVPACKKCRTVCVQRCGTF